MPVILLYISKQYSDCFLNARNNRICYVRIEGGGGKETHANNIEQSTDDTN